MIRNIMLVSALALSAPAFAQEATTPPAEDAAATQAAPAAAKAAPTQVAEVVEADFPAYDADKNGELSQAEFAEWMLKLRAASSAQGAATADADLKAWAGAAFAQADADKSKSVSKGELTKFLAG